MLAALEAAGMAGGLGRWPRGLGSSVRRLLESGHDLSMGEWPRLAIARLLHRGADAWIPDEPTTALDDESEAAIVAEPCQCLRGRTLIVMLHRFSTLRVADWIAVPAIGRGGELRPHDELMAAGGRRHARLVPSCRRAVTGEASASQPDRFLVHFRRGHQCGSSSSLPIVLRASRSS